jgi:hypothetical protein
MTPTLWIIWGIVTVVGVAAFVDVWTTLEERKRNKNNPKPVEKPRDMELIRTRVDLRHAVGRKKWIAEHSATNPELQAEWERVSKEADITIAKANKFLMERGLMK